MSERVELKPQDETDEADESAVVVDLRDAYILLGKAFILLSYLSDTDLRRNIAERERVAMRAMSDKIEDFRQEIKDTYSNTELEELFQ